MPCRVLLAENTIRGLGGSYESLFVTATSLDRRRFEPVVLFFQPNHFVEKLEARGVRVLLASSRQFWEREGYMEKASRVKAAVPRRGLLGSLRKSVVGLLRALVGGVPMALTLRRILRRERIDLLHTNNNLERDAMMILGAALAGVPVLAHERQLAPMTWIGRWLSSRVAVLVCISDAVLEFTRGNGCRVRDRRRVHNAIDIASARGARSSLPGGPQRIGIVGRIMRKKGQRQFVEAGALVLKQFPGAELYIIGQATGEDRAYEEEVRELARRLGISERVRWTGYVSQPLEIMAALDVVVHAAIEPEPFGRVIIEALALGRPVVATALGGPVEILEDGVSGFLVPAEDPAAIARRVIEILSSSDLARGMGAAAARRAEDFGVESYIRQIELAYEDVLIAAGKPEKISTPEP